MKHKCGRKNTVHHIEKPLGVPIKQLDNPLNLITVCQEVHWGLLHNGASEQQKVEWAKELGKIAETNTAEAIRRGNFWPD